MTARPSAGIGWAVGLLPTVALVAAATACIRPVATYRTLALGGDALAVGLVAGAFGVLSFVAAIPIGRLIDRRSPRRFILAGAGLIAFGAGLAILADSIAVLAISQALLGLGQIVAILGGQVLLTGRATGPMRATWFGRYTLAASIGMFLGPSVGSAVVVAAASGLPPGSLIPDAGTDLAFGVAALLGLSAFTLTFAMPAAATAVESQAVERRAGMGAILTVPGMRGSMIASIAILIANDVVIAYLPVYGTVAAMPVSLIGVLLAALTGAAVLSRAAMGRLVQTVGAGRVLAAAIWLAAVCLIAFPLANQPVLQVVLVAVTGACFGLGQPITLLAVASLAPTGARAAALGARLAGNRLGQVVAPAAAGWISGASEVSSTFVTMAVVLGVAGLSVGTGEPLSGIDRVPAVPAVPSEE